MDKNEIGKRIRKIRTELGMTMEEFGKKIDDVKSGVVSNWENGKQLPNKKRLKAIADLSDISVDSLLYGDLKERIEKIADDYIQNEIKLNNNNDIKVYYDKYRFNDLVIKVFIEIREKQLKLNTVYTDRDILDVLKRFISNELSFEKYQPYNNKNALFLTNDILKNTINEIDRYFSMSLYDDTLIEHDKLKFEDYNDGLYFLPKLHYSKRRIKPDLTEKLYDQIIIEIENCIERINEIQIDNYLTEYEKLKLKFSNKED